jgi:hypothetical protein
VNILEAEVARYTESFRGAGYPEMGTDGSVDANIIALDQTGDLAEVTLFEIHVGFQLIRISG